MSSAFFFSDVFSCLFFLGFTKIASAFLFSCCIVFLVVTVKQKVAKSTHGAS